MPKDFDFDSDTLGDGSPPNTWPRLCLWEGVAGEVGEFVPAVEYDVVVTAVDVLIVDLDETLLESLMNDLAILYSMCCSRVLLPCGR